MFKKSLAILLLFVALAACGKADAPTWQEQYDLGVRYLSEGNYEEAILAFSAAIEIDPKQADAYVGRGDAYVLSGETGENLTAAQADYEKAIELDDTLAEAYLGLADVYIRQGDYDKALEILQQGLEKTGDDQEIVDKLDEVRLINPIDPIDPNLNIQLDSVFENPLQLEEILVNGIPITETNIDNNSSALIVNGRIYIVDDSLQVRGLSRGMEKSSVLHAIGFSEYGIDLCNESKDIRISLDEKECTQFSEITFSDIDEAIIIELTSKGNTVNLLLGFESNILQYLECDSAA